MKIIGCSLLMLAAQIFGCAHMSKTNTPQYFVVRNKKELKSPEKIEDYRRFNYKGKYYAVRQFPKTIYFRDFSLLNNWLKENEKVDLTKFDGVAATAIDLMKDHQAKVSRILELGAEKPIVYREMERFVNSTSNYFFRAKDQEHRKYTGYVTSGNGINQCSRKIDTSWGLDCSGFVWLTHFMSGRDHPLMKSDDLWAIEGEKSGAYSKKTVKKFFEITQDPKVGDLVLQNGHVGFFLKDGLSVAMDSDGVSVEYYRDRNRVPNEHAEVSSKMKTTYLKYVGKGLKGPLNPSSNIAKRLSDIDPGKFFSKSFLKKSEKDPWARRKYGQALYYTIKNSRKGMKVLGTDFRGRGSGADLCRDLKTLKAKR